MSLRKRRGKNCLDYSEVNAVQTGKSDPRVLLMFTIIEFGTAAALNVH